MSRVRSAGHTMAKAGDRRDMRRTGLGLSLVELIVFIVVVGTATAGVLAALNLATRASVDPMVQKQTLALAEAVQDPSLRIVLDTGNLLDAGENPISFACALEEKGLLLPDLHIKDSTRATNSSQIPDFEPLRTLLDQAVVRSILVENDYGNNPERLCFDIIHARQTVAHTCGEALP